MPFPGSPLGSLLLVLQMPHRYHLRPQYSKVEFVPLLRLPPVISPIMFHWNELSAHHTVTFLRTRTCWCAFPVPSPVNDTQWELNKYLLNEWMTKGMNDEDQVLIYAKSILSSFQNFHILYPCDSCHYHGSGWGVSTCNSNTVYTEAGHVMAQTPNEDPEYRVLSTAAQSGDWATIMTHNNTLLLLIQTVYQNMSVWNTTEIILNSLFLFFKSKLFLFYSWWHDRLEILKSSHIITLNYA